jgi:hypothetical protein
MGMVQTFLRKIPDNISIESFIEEVRSKVEENLNRDGEDYEKVVAYAVPVAEFEELWNEQENLNKTPEVKSKYKELASKGQLIAVEIDW